MTSPEYDQKAGATIQIDVASMSSLALACVIEALADNAAADGRADGAIRLREAADFVQNEPDGTVRQCLRSRLNPSLTITD